MKIKIYDIYGVEYESCEICEINFTQTAGVPCDSLCFYFHSDEAPDEINAVTAFDNEALVFSGYCDCMRLSETSKGFECFIYARSAAALLIDSEAAPFTYNCPTARQLWYMTAREKGFKYALPDVTGSDKYEVSKGTSCFGAISDFVELNTGKIMYVTPEKELKCFETNNTVKSLNSFNILNYSYTVNRSEPLSKLCIKKSQEQSGYSMKMLSKTGRDMGIDRVKYLNLQSLPKWQREHTALKKLKSSYDNYKVLTVNVSGYVNEDLYGRFSFVSQSGIRCDDYVLTEKKYTFDSNGSVTKLTLKKQIDVGEYVYVD